jgi:hypothetical protein
MKCEQKMYLYQIKMTDAPVFVLLLIMCALLVMHDRGQPRGTAVPDHAGADDGPGNGANIMCTNGLYYEFHLYEFCFLYLS